MKRDSKEYFDWWHERIDRFERLYPYLFVSGWGDGVSIRLRDRRECTSYLAFGIFLKMIGEDKGWWE
jgi:hypothetical protein